MKKKKEDKTISLTGNKGADLLLITEIEEGMIWLELGHCCVSVIQRVVPVEFLTAVLSKAILDNNGDLSVIIDSFDWDANFKEELKTKVMTFYDYLKKREQLERDEKEEL